MAPSPNMLPQIEVSPLFSGFLVRWQWQWIVIKHVKAVLESGIGLSIHIPRGLHLGTRTTPCSRVALGAFSLTEAQRRFDSSWQHACCWNQMVLHPSADVLTLLPALHPCRISDRRLFGNQPASKVGLIWWLLNCSSSQHHWSEMPVIDFIILQLFPSLRRPWSWDFAWFSKLWHCYGIYWSGPMDAAAGNAGTFSLSICRERERKKEREREKKKKTWEKKEYIMRKRDRPW